MKENGKFNLSKVVEGVSVANQILIDQKTADSIHSMYKAADSASKTFSLLLFELPAQIDAAVNRTIFSEVIASIESAVRNYSYALNDVLESPFVKWLSSIDISSLFIAWGVSPKESKQISKIYLNAMYHAKWFPYLAYLSDEDLLIEINVILENNQISEQQAEGYIDEAILSYFTDERVRKIRDRWQDTISGYSLQRILCEAGDSFIRGEYYLTVSALAPLWEGIVRSKTVEGTKKPKEGFKKLADRNGVDEVFSDFYCNWIRANCKKDSDLTEGIPNRHAVSHGRMLNSYPNKKAALNAILLTDFLLGLKPIAGAGGGGTD